MFSGPGWKETVLSTIFALHQSQQAAVEHEEVSWLNFAVSEIWEVYLVKGNKMKMRSLKLKDLTAAVNRRRGAEMVGYFRTRGVATWDKTTCWLRPVWWLQIPFLLLLRLFCSDRLSTHPSLHSLWGKSLSGDFITPFILILYSLTAAKLVGLHSCASSAADHL